MKKILFIKWEVLALVLHLILGVVAIIHHINIGGITSWFACDVVINILMMPLVMYLIVYSIRAEIKEWYKNEKNNSSNN